jgi:hypothetical protein
VLLRARWRPPARERLSAPHGHAAARRRTSFEDFFARAPPLTPLRSSITGAVCGVRVETIAEPTMREIRYLAKLSDELAKGKVMPQVIRP